MAARMDVFKSRVAGGAGRAGAAAGATAANGVAGAVDGAGDGTGTGAGEGEASMADLGYSQEIVRTPSKDEIVNSILRSEYYSSTEGQIDFAVLAVASESPHYGPALATTSKKDGSDESLESYLAGWVTKPKRSENSLDSIFADEAWM